MNGKKLVRGIIVTMLCMLGMLYLNSSVGKAYQVVVSGDKINVRGSASTDSEVMTTVDKGTKLEVVSEEQDGEGKTWYEVSVNNVSGYVRSDMVKKESEAGAAEQPVASSAVVEPVPSQEATVNKNDVNVRATASTNGKVVATLKEGDVVMLTGTIVDGSSKTWYQVNFINNGSSNVTGFIREDFVTPVEVTEEAPQESEAGLEEIYGDMPAEDAAAVNNDYELFFEPDKEGVNAWYIHDNKIQKRYKLEQLLAADKVNAENLAIMDKQLGKLRIAVIVLAVLLVLALVAAGFFGFKCHEMKDDGDEEDDDEEDDDDDDVRKAPPVRRRASREPEVRDREASGSTEKAVRPVLRKPEAGVQRRPEAGTSRKPETGTQRKPASGAPRRSEAEGESRTPQSRPQARRPEAGGQRRPTSAPVKQRSTQPEGEVKKVPVMKEEAPPSRKSSRGDVEWKSKNFLSGDEDELDFSFINMNDDE